MCVYAEDCARACSIQIYSKQFYSNRKKLIRGTYQLQQQHWLIKVPSPHVWPVNSYIYTSGFRCVRVTFFLCVCCGKICVCFCPFLPTFHNSFGPPIRPVKGEYFVNCPANYVISHMCVRIDCQLVAVCVFTQTACVCLGRQFSCNYV